MWPSQFFCCRQKLRKMRIYWNMCCVYKYSLPCETMNIVTIQSTDMHRLMMPHIMFEIFTGSNDFVRPFNKRAVIFNVYSFLFQTIETWNQSPVCGEICAHGCFLFYSVISVKIPNLAFCYFHFPYNSHSDLWIKTSKLQAEQLRM